MKHKVMLAIGDEQVKDIKMKNINHPSSVTNEVLSVLSTLNMPPTGINSLSLDHWWSLDSKVS